MTDLAGTSTAADGFLRTIVDHLVRNDGKWTNSIPFVFEQSTIGQHVSACGVAEVFNVRQESVVETHRQAYGPDKTEAVSYLSANFRCRCGDYALINLRQRTGLGNIMYEIEHGMVTA